jgi:hypothetical protein
MVKTISILQGKNPANEKIFYRGLRAGLAVAGGYSLLAFAREQFQHEKPDSDHDCRVRDVEVGPRIAAPEAKMQKIDDFLSKDAIDEVPNRASENQTKRERRKPIPGGEFSIERNDDPDCDQRYGYEESEAVNLRSIRKQTELLRLRCRTSAT